MQAHGLSREGGQPAAADRRFTRGTRYGRGVSDSGKKNSLRAKAVVAQELLDAQEQAVEQARRKIGQTGLRGSNAFPLNPLRVFVLSLLRGCVSVCLR